ncbi:proteasome assembly chaperone family protein [Methanonatronarchaeum sp. AMET-Sl]|uniref:proteasome assembly chaperone family protein n=1 Tax=Methanonatronarchaeum sp. AMET-Sl TaxID=3037654 RepID=UPI00244E0053|nr:proteasome assembly chaperone family protein [Methanonatronarchaeum sp. AMET-Sl]WGI17108.1 proteasome assembly chaperone family protein [Methanonatronarchaeum sp. AMET-Sl]
MQTHINYLNEINLNNPILIEGLPGVGHIGKLAAEHLVDELEAEKTAEIFSPYLPPQVIVQDDGIARLVRIEIYTAELENNKNDVILVVGDHQSVENTGHFEITEKILDIATENNVQTIYTIGGLATGEMSDTPEIYGAVNEHYPKQKLEEKGVKFEQGKPKGGIIGASGLLLGLGNQKEIPATCLMGETSGYIVDPASAQKVLRILSEMLEIEIDTKKLEERAEEMEEVVSKLKQRYQEEQQQPQPTGDDLRYIG